MSRYQDWTLTDQRRAHRMYERGMSWAEVGQEFGVSAGAVRKAVARGKRSPQWEGGGGGIHAELPPPEALFPDWEIPEDVNWREILKAFENTLELHKRLDPNQEILTVGLKHVERPIAIAFAADLHMGGGFTDHAEIRRSVDYILNTEGLYLGIAGDSIEGFIPGLKSAETSEQMAGSTKIQVAALRSLVQELSDAGKIIFLTWGDHDSKWFEKLIGWNVIKHSMHDKVPYFPGRGLVRLQLGEEEYYISVNHSERFTSQWNKVHPSRRQYERFFPADINVTAHKHKPAFQMDHHYQQLREAGINLGGKHWMVVTGTFKTGPDPYTIRAWEKGVIGVPTVVFRPDVHDTDCFESPVKAVRYMRGLEAEQQEAA